MTIQPAFLFMRPPISSLISKLGLRSKRVKEFALGISKEGRQLTSRSSRLTVRGKPPGE
jgi:hypothetical protein